MTRTKTRSLIRHETQPSPRASATRFEPSHSSSMITPKFGVPGAKAR
uniref:Uncharacterized protein n=1 Tax=Arundo donax TaxID=35708 RepID=A0A0A8YR76_ARUDO